MAREAEKTTNRDEIIKWAEGRQGVPAKVAGTEAGGSFMLRLKFPEYSGNRTLEEISWDEFFRVFNERNLAFLYEKTAPDGEPSRFFKIVAR